MLQPMGLQELDMTEQLKCTELEALGFSRQEELPYHPANPTPGQIPREKHDSKGHMQPYVHCSTVYNSQDMEAP